MGMDFKVNQLSVWRGGSDGHGFQGELAKCVEGGGVMGMDKARGVGRGGDCNPYPSGNQLPSHFL